MNKDELIKYKEYLMQINNRKYGFYDHSDSSVEFDDLKTESELTSVINMDHVIMEFESFLEKCVKYLVDNGIDFDRIRLLMPSNFYASERFLKKAKNSRDVPFTKEDVLYDVVPLTIWVTAYDSNGHDTFPNHFVNEDNNFAIFGFDAVKYSEFVEKLDELGYDISLKNFDEYFEAGLNMSGPEINIDFSKGKNNIR